LNTVVGNSGRIIDFQSVELVGERCGWGPEEIIAGLATSDCLDGLESSWVTVLQVDSDCAVRSRPGNVEGASSSNGLESSWPGGDDDGIGKRSEGAGDKKARGIHFEWVRIMSRVVI